MNAILKPIALGLVAYAVSAIGLWFVLVFVLLPVSMYLGWLVPATITLVPLFVSGYFGAKYAESHYRVRRIVTGGIAGLVGFVVSLVITRAQGELWLFSLFILGAALVAAAGGFISTRPKNAL